VRPQEREARGRRRSVWPSLGLAVGVLALLYLVGWMVTGTRYSRELARLRAHGEPVLLSELAPKLMPGERNAADVYEQAFALAPVQGLDQLYMNGTWQWNPSDLPLARAIVNGSPQYFALLAEASRLPTCAFAIDWDGRWGQHFSHVDLGQALRALSVKAQLQAHDGDLDGALATCATSLRVAAHGEQVPDSGERIMGSYIQSWLLADLGEALSLGDPSAASCRSLADLLAARDYHALLVQSVRAQRASGLATMRWMEKGQWFVQRPPRSARWVVREAYPVIAKPLWNADKERYLEVMAAYIEAAKRPWPEAGKEAVRLDRHVKQLFPPRASPMTWIAPSDAGIFGRTGRDAATAGAWQVALALKAYHHDRGVYPATLAEVERTGWKLPNDLFTDKPYHYRRDGTGFVVWSVGFDLKDNAARPFPGDWDNYMSPGYDFVVRCAR
jgi:hypothetical protein